MITRHSASLAIATLIISLAALPAQAQSRHSHVRRAKEKAAAGNVQVDGIFDSFVDDLWKQGDNYWHQGDYPRIVALDRIIVQVDPHFVECYATGGWLMESLGRLTDAEAFYQQGAANNPDSSYAYYNLGMFYFNTLKDYHASLAVFQRDAKVADTEDKDYKMLAHSYERTGDWKAALAVWKTIKKRWPNSPAVDVNLKRVEQRVNLETSASVSAP
jgi:tetratricopeptide (TPR) repeat protein